MEGWRDGYTEILQLDMCMPACLPISGDGLLVGIAGVVAVVMECMACCSMLSRDDRENRENSDRDAR